MAAAAGQPSKLVVFFMENHTADNLCSDVSGFDGDTSLGQAADSHPDQPHDWQTWLHRAGRAVRERYPRAQLPLLHSLMDAYTVCDRYFSDVGAGSSMAASEQWLHQQVLEVANGRTKDGSSLWDDVMMLITFDDWGGWADHVDPPVLESDADGPYRMGSRVPMIVVGPYAKPRYVSHVQASHTSIVAYQERLHGLPPTNPRTRAPAETALSDTYDLTQRPLPPPAAVPAAA